MKFSAHKHPLHHFVGTSRGLCWLHVPPSDLWRVQGKVRLQYLRNMKIFVEYKHLSLWKYEHQKIGELPSISLPALADLPGFVPAPVTSVVAVSFRWLCHRVVILIGRIWSISTQGILKKCDQDCQKCQTASTICIRNSFMTLCIILKHLPLLTLSQICDIFASNFRIFLSKT